MLLLEIIMDILFGILDSINIISIVKFSIENNIIFESLFFLIINFIYDFCSKYYVNYLFYFIYKYYQNILILLILNKLSSTKGKNNILYENIILFFIIYVVNCTALIFNNAISIPIYSIYYSILTHNYYWNYSNFNLDEKMTNFCDNWCYHIGYGLFLSLLNMYNIPNIWFCIFFLNSIIYPFIGNSKKIANYPKISKNLVYKTINTIYRLIKYLVKKIK